MQTLPLDILRCPFCGGRLTQIGAGTAEATMPRAGILCCQCCAYPVVEGIPYIRTGKIANAAMRLLGEGQSSHALLTLLGLPETQWEPFERLLRQHRSATFRE